MRVAIIGSGPAAVACTMALMRRGVQVTMLDVGDELDTRTQLIVNRMRGQTAQDWTDADIAEITRNPTIGNRPIPRRLAFGSDYIYGIDQDHAPIIQQGVSIAPTYARGGYSKVWGASMMPVHQDDIGDWPILRNSLDPYYRRVLDGFPYSARNDNLSDEFPVFATSPDPLPMPPQIKAFSADLDGIAREQKGDIILHGQSRLAVRARDEGQESGCVHCGLCLSGCVKGAIYSTNVDLDRLIKLRQLDYRRNHHVESVMDLEDGAEIRCLGPDGVTREIHRFDKVFVAAGAVNSTRILMTSRNLFDQTLLLRHSPKFVLPFLRWQSTPIEWPNVNTLTGLLLELRLRGVSPHWMHAQISVINDMVLKNLKAYANDNWTLRGRLAQPFLRRLMVAWCGLHSNEADPIKLTLRKSASKGTAVLQISATTDTRLNKTIKRAAWRMTRHGLTFRALFLAPFRVIGTTGDGNHNGGTLPMRNNPQHPNETDLLGRPKDWTNVHFVDASILPSIPATTLALTIMANASRIGDTVNLES